MNITQIRKNNLPQKGEKFDVLVCGGGPAGIGAAIAASNLGVKVLLLEGSSLLGGVASAGMWMPVNRITLDGVTVEGGRRGGVFNTFVDKILSYGCDAYSKVRHPSTDVRGGLQIHPDFLRQAIFELLEECDCKYRLYSPVVGVVINGNQIKGVEVGTKDGVETFFASCIIDCTGDGDVASYAGVKMKKGRESDGIFLPPALLFAIANVNTEQFFKYKLEEHQMYLKQLELASEKGYLVCKWYDFDETSIPNVINVNNGGLNDWEKLDMTDPADRTVAERMGIKAAIDFVKFARELKIPGLEKCYLARVGYQVAIRDTRRIVGEYTITHEDAIKAPEFHDIVSRRYGFIDAVGYYQAEMVSGHAYPYRCLLPIGVEGLLVAGRCASATHLGFASGRGMGECMGMGQAAGIAAAISVKQGVFPRDVEIAEVQRHIRNSGIKL